MRGVDTFVTEIAVDFEHTVDTAHEAALEEQFRSDAQIQVDIEGIHMRGERACRGAAVHGLQHWRFYLEEVMAFEGVTQRGDHGGTLTHHIANAFIGDHADVRLAGARVVAQLLMQGRQRLQGLRRDTPFAGEDGQFAGLRSDDAALEEQVVTQIDHLLELLQGIRADLLLGDHALDGGAVALGELDKAQAAAVAQEKHATGDADDILRLVTGVELAVVLGTYLADGGGHIDMDRVRLHTFLEHERALGDTHLNLLGVCERTEFLVTRVDRLVKALAFIDIGADLLVLLQQKFCMFDGRHDRRVFSMLGMLFRGVFRGLFRVRHAPQCIEVPIHNATHRFGIVLQLLYSNGRCQNGL